MRILKTDEYKKYCKQERSYKYLTWGAGSNRDLYCKYEHDINESSSC